jgi:hypothetical protein
LDRRQQNAGDVGVALGLGGRYVPCRAIALPGIDHLLGLPAEPSLDDRLERGVGKQRLEHLILVGIDGALPHVFAQAPSGVYDRDLVETGLGIDREHHSSAAQFRAHHGLDADR